MSLNRFVEVISTSPAKVFGLYHQKGTIAINSDADLIIFDPQRETIIRNQDLHHNCDYTAYEHYEETGCIETVLCRGEIVFNNGEFVGRPGAGIYVKRKPSNY